MRRDYRMIGLMMGVLAASSGLQSCLANARDCSQNGSCSEGTSDTGGAAGNGGATTTGACNEDADCTASGPCVVGVCESGSCRDLPVADGEHLDDTECGQTCQGGVPQFAPATELCQGTRVCDGAGSCVACDNDHACPDEYGCTSNGECTLGLGTSCEIDDHCPGAYCVYGVCCKLDCGTCNHCDPASFTACLPVTKNEYRSDCRAEDGLACDGAGSCKYDTGHSCSSPTECASHNCTGIPKVCTP